MDARGSRLTPAKAQQTAVGVVLPRSRTGEISGSWFMDWRRDNGAPADAPPSFLYVVPVADDRVLVEETCLVGRPPLGYRELRARLQTRLQNRGVRLRGDEPEEHVRFAVEAEPADPARDAGPRRTAPLAHRRPGRDHAPGHRLQRRPVPAAGRRPGRPAGGRRPGRSGRPAPQPTATAGPPAPESGPDHAAPPAARRRARPSSRRSSGSHRTGSGPTSPATSSRPGWPARWPRWPRTLDPRLTALAVGSTLTSLVRPTDRSGDTP